MAIYNDYDDSVTNLMLGAHNDRLAQIFKIQRDFAAMVRSDLVAADVWDMIAQWQSEMREVEVPLHVRTILTDRIGLYATCLAQEAAELRDWTPWKEWSSSLGNRLDKKGEIVPWSEEHIREMQMECIDLLKFLVTVMQWLNMDERVVYEMFLEKSGICEKRLEDHH